MDGIVPEAVAELREAITGEIKIDPISRILFSTDASIHQIEPLGVVFPRNTAELSSIVKVCYKHNIPIIARGSGSGLAGQSIGIGLIVDCSRYLDHIVDINPETLTATVEPGVILDELNRQAKKYKLQFGPDPASSERATLGGCIGNNATGAHSIIYGMTADHILSADVALADGSVTSLRAVSLETAQQIANGSETLSTPGLESGLYQAAFKIRDEYSDEIKKKWPVTWRRASGYNLNYLLPWSPTSPPQWDDSLLPYPPILPGTLNLAPLLAGSEGTLGIIRNVTLRLVPIRKHSILAVVNFTSILDACDAVSRIMELSPTAIELIPRSLIQLARSVPAYANQLSFVTGDPSAILVVEFSGDDPKQIHSQIMALTSIYNRTDPPYIAETLKQQNQVWQVRKVGLGILMSRLGALKPISFIEDMSVPVERLAEFVREMDIILTNHNTQADFYGHASAGCLHIRPLLNIKSKTGKAELRSIAEASANLVIQLGGAVSSEHGDGITRGEWIERAYGPMIVEAFQKLKTAADPKGLLNPGKIVNTPPMDSSLRYHEKYHPVGWAPVMVFSSSHPDSEQLVEAIELCNGAGVCRKSTGVMCPSFQATRDELFSTRGRANLLRAMVANAPEATGMTTQAVKETLELCLACKGCKAECPSAVDMAKLKYEYFEHYYTLPSHHHPIRDYLFGYIAQIARVGSWMAPLANIFISNPLFAGLREKLFGLSRKRQLPQFSRISLHRRLRKQNTDNGEPDCLLLLDAFNDYFFPETSLDALRVLYAFGIRTRILSTIGAGRTLISKGFVTRAKLHARHLIAEINRLDPSGRLPVIGLEPSEIYTLKDEYIDLFPNEAFVAGLAQRVFMIDEYLIRSKPIGATWLPEVLSQKERDLTRTNVLIHGHCYQKAQPPAADGLPIGVAATVIMLETAGYIVRTIDDGCCGMAGAFGYEREHYSVSMQVGELALLPTIRSSDNELIVAAGISCKSQIEDGTGKRVYHPISLVARLVGDQESWN